MQEWLLGHLLPRRRRSKVALSFVGKRLFSRRMAKGEAGASRSGGAAKKKKWSKGKVSVGMN